MGTKAVENDRYTVTQLQRDTIIRLLKEKGLRITKQRCILLDIILSQGCSCCKEIYYQAVKQNVKLGKATVYRMINTLEEAGVINRKNMYKIDCLCGQESLYENKKVCTVELEDNTVYNLTSEKLKYIVGAGLNALGYSGTPFVKTVIIN